MSRDDYKAHESDNVRVNLFKSLKAQEVNPHSNSAATW